MSVIGEGSDEPFEDARLPGRSAVDPLVALAAQLRQEDPRLARLLVDGLQPGFTLRSYTSTFLAAAFLLSVLFWATLLPIFFLFAIGIVTFTLVVRISDDEDVARWEHRLGRLCDLFRLRRR